MRLLIVGCLAASQQPCSDSTGKTIGAIRSGPSGHGGAHHAVTGRLASARLPQSRGGRLGHPRHHSEERIGRCEALVKQVGVTYPIVPDEPGKVADRCGAVTLPVQHWIARGGLVRGWAFGERPLDQYDTSLAKILPAWSLIP